MVKISKPQRQGKNKGTTDTKKKEAVTVLISCKSTHCSKQIMRKIYIGHVRYPIWAKTYVSRSNLRRALQ